MPTFIELSGASSSNDSGGPLSGTSLVSALSNCSPSTPLSRPDLYFHHDGNRAIRSGNVKAIAFSTRLDLYGDGGVWRLYDMSVDRSEQNDIASEHPEKLKELVEKWRKMTQGFAKDAQRP